MTSSAQQYVEVSADEFRRLFGEVQSWGRWGSDDERGALNYLTPDHVIAASRLVDSGVTVSLSLPLATKAAASHPQPADFHMTMLADTDIGSGSLRFAKDYVGVDYHNDGHTHIDALSHVAYRESLYNDKVQSAVSAQGAGVESIEVLANGLVGRGVLLDIPRSRGTEWIEPGEHVFADDFEEAERQQGTKVENGDIVLVRTGHVRRLSALGPWDTETAKAGLHPTAMRFMAQRRIAALGSDGNSDTAPSGTEGVSFPIHVLAINAMGVHLLDYLQFEDLRKVCEQHKRWDFLVVAAPLRVVGATGSPLNPIAIF